MRDVTVDFPIRRGFLQRVQGHVHAVRGVSFVVPSSQTTALVGESGSGKSTLARCITSLLEPTSGSIKMGTVDLRLGERDGSSVNVRKLVQMVLQNPYDSLNPYMTVRELVAEGMVVNRTAGKSEIRSRTTDLINAVGLSAGLADARPRQLSGGQRQRVAIARALAVDPRLLVLDEAVSALDVSVQAQILELLQDLQQSLGTTYLLITHDLSILGHFSEQTVVLYLGLVMESGSTSSMLADPLHPYTSALVASGYQRTDGTHPDLMTDKGLGEVPSSTNPPSGCPYRTRCPRAAPVCAAEQPELREVLSDRFVACHFPLV